jgi:hypothetical protein
MITAESLTAYATEINDMFYDLVARRETLDGADFSVLVANAIERARSAFDREALIQIVTGLHHLAILLKDNNQLTNQGITLGMLMIATLACNVVPPHITEAEARVLEFVVARPGVTSNEIHARFPDMSDSPQVLIKRMVGGVVHYEPAPAAQGALERHAIEQIRKEPRRMGR